MGIIYAPSEGMIYAPGGMIYNRKGKLQIETHLIIINHASWSVIMFIEQATDVFK